MARAGVHVRLEAVVGLGDDYTSCVVVDIETVFREIRVEQDNFVAWVQDRLEHHVDRPRRRWS